MKKNLTANEQLLLAIEFLSLAEEYNIRKKQLTSLTLSEWLDELQDPDKESKDSQWSLDRKFRTYADKLKDFGVSVNLKTKKIRVKNSTIPFKILSTYIQDFCENYNEKLLRIYFRIKDENFFEVLRNLVLIRYAIRYSLPLEIEYHKMMSFESATRRVIPRYLHSRDQYLTLVATDNKDNVSKHFVLVNILSFNSDLLSCYKNRTSRTKIISFDREKFNKSPENSFYRPMIAYMIDFSCFSFEHFVKTNDVDFKILKKTAKSVVAEIKCDDEFFMLASLFNYGDNIKLLSPEKNLRNFQKKIASLYQHYEK